MEDGYHEIEYDDNHDLAGHVYVGEIKDGLRHGQGQITYPNGDIFRGLFREDDVVYGEFLFLSEKTGRNRYLGDIYEGEFENGTFNGKGIYYYLSKNHITPGDKYEGHFKDGNRHGQGIYYYADGSTEEGLWSSGWITGVGKLTFPDGDLYEGMLEKGVPSGIGTYFWSNGDSYAGYYLKGERTGEGIYTYFDGRIIEGDFNCGSINDEHIGQVENKWSSHTIESLIEYSMKLKKINLEIQSKTNPNDARDTIDLLKDNESQTLEFKSSLWTQYNESIGMIVKQQTKKMLELEDEVVKTVAAFLNTDGGTLLIGVRDKPRSSGDAIAEIRGVEPDFKWLKKKDVEGYTHALIQIFDNAYSNPLANHNMTISFPEFDGKIICRIDVEALPRKVGQQCYTKTKIETEFGKSDLFFTRTSDTTKNESPRSQYGYIRHHFEGFSGGNNLEDN